MLSCFWRWFPGLLQGLFSRHFKVACCCANAQQCFVYKYQGQYAYQISYQGVSPYGFQTAGNMLAFVSGLIAAALYGNIGIVWPPPPHHFQT